MKHSISESKITEVVCMVAAFLCILLVISDIVRRNFTPITIILDAIILIVDVGYVVRFIKKKRNRK